MKRVPELDGLRGLAILAVLVHHSSSTLGSLGWVGVDLFFVLSGFLIGGILIDSRRSVGYFSGFYRRRAFRILPLYLTMCLAGVVLAPLTHRTLMPWYAYAFGANVWTAVHGWTNGYLDVAWSLSSEEQFYLILPVLIWIVPPRRLPLVIAALLALSVIPSWTWYTLRADGLLFGVAAALVVRSQARTWLSGRPHLLLGSMLVATGGIGWSLRYWAENRFCLAATLFFFVLLLLVVLQPDSACGRICRVRWLRSLGTISYCLYLVHVPALELVRELIPNRALASLTGLALALTVSALSWKYFESPLIAYGRRTPTRFAVLERLTP